MDLASDIDVWIARIGEPREEFNGHSPCPFAKGAKYKALSCRHIEDARACMVALDTKSVVILDLPLTLSLEARALVDELREHLRLAGLWAFVSDPQNPVVVKGYQTTQKTRLLIIVQPYDELVKASALLERHGYYKNWDEETLRSVKGGR